MDAKSLVEKLVNGNDDKSIASVIPAIIRILEEGDAATRIAKMLVDSGWTGRDAWREFKNIPLPDTISSSVINDLSGYDKGIEVCNRWQSEARNLKIYLKHTNKHRSK